MKKAIIAMCCMLFGCNGYVTPIGFETATKACADRQGVNYTWVSFWDPSDIFARCKDGSRVEIQGK